MSTIYYRRGFGNVSMVLVLADEFSLNFDDALALLEKIYSKYDFTDITKEELINYAWDNMEKLK